MAVALGIRREDKNRWERRVPITPKHVRELKEKYDIETVIQPSKIRVFSDKEYESSGAQVKEKLSSPVIFAIKEIPADFFEKGKTYVFFSHTIKGQTHNMPMLKSMMELGCNLIDYERITDEKERRLVFFGRFAGLAGMIDALWAFGQRMKSKGINTPLSEIKQSYHYSSLDEAKKHLKKIGKKIEKKGMPNSLAPIVVGFAGYGNVSKGAQEILDILPVKEISPTQLETIQKKFSDKVIYKVVFKEEDTVEPVSPGKNFNLQEYYNHPNLYRSVFQQYIPHLSILMNCIFWNKQYPRLVTKKFLKDNYNEKFKLQVIGDISVDINGAIEFTEKVTSPDSPVFVYNPSIDKIIDGHSGDGVVVMAIDNLPCEVPRESSQFFSDTLMNFIPPIVKADFSVDFDKVDLPIEIKKAVVLHHGKLTPDYRYINKFL